MYYLCIENKILSLNPHCRYIFAIDLHGKSVFAGGKKILKILSPLSGKEFPIDVLIPLVPPIDRTAAVNLVKDTC